MTSLGLGLLCYGLFINFVDLGANAVAADFDAHHGGPAMTGLHAWFSFGALAGAGRLWRSPGVGLAIAVAAVCFLGDGALENFLSTFLRQALGAGYLMVGVGIGGYHLASMCGRRCLWRAGPRPGGRAGPWESRPPSAMARPFSPRS